MSLPEADTVERRAIRVRGTVQGVGFRPFVYRLASALGLGGSVRNDADGVLIEAQGDAATLDDFEHRLRVEAPPLARVEGIDSSPRPPARAAGFAILDSRPGRVTTAVAPDTAPCGDCLRELFDPAGRRYRHAFVNCTNCGPRYTLTRSLPYDRASTSMAAFALCRPCRREYDDPADRRFHAEPNACPDCGPTLGLVGADGRAIAGDPIEATIALLRGGAVVAIKGLGGFHLACDARNPMAVAALRGRKQRDAKPFAVMAPNLDAAQRWVAADAAAQALLASPARPIVLLPLRVDRPDALDGVAPGLHRLGVMLPATPIQHLIARGAPDLLLVMTSANPGGEPIVAANDEALRRLHGIADALLLHDRDIVARCDDSVVRVGTDGAPRFVRRARGVVPRSIRLPHAGPPVLATGAWLKNTVCLTRGDEAVLSPHLGDLDDAATRDALAEAVEHLGRILDVRPQAVAHDLHPDSFASRFAFAFAAARGLPAIAVQHHHAHVAAVAAEHGHRGPLLGLALDGIGLGTDGRAWGGELLRVDGAAFERIGHLAPLALPGGDAAAREPWRSAAAALHGLGRGHEIVARFADQRAAEAVAQMLARGVRCPPTTSLGRWFDAAAALLGVCATSAYEGEAPMRLEALAERVGPHRAGDLDDLVEIGAAGVLDPAPLLGRLADESDAARGAALFHDALADGLARWVAQAAAATGLRHVALGGGCFLNARLSARVAARLDAIGLVPLEARQAPPNDGGLALGQAWVAIATLTQGD